MPFFSRKNRRRPRANTGRNNNSDAQPPPTFRVQIPNNVQPGEDFNVIIRSSTMIRVRCPPNSRAGDFVQFDLPPDLIATRSSTPLSHHHQLLHQHIIDAPVSQVINAPVQRAGSSQLQQFNSAVRNETPTTRNNETHHDNGMNSPTTSANPPSSSSSTTTIPSQKFEVVVPPGIRPGFPFALMAGGVRVMVTCPPNARPGQKIRFQIPHEILHQQQQDADGDNTEVIRLPYDSSKDGWIRIIRCTDWKFRWVHINDTTSSSSSSTENNDVVISNEKAYTRDLQYDKKTSKGPLRRGHLSLVRAEDATTDSRISLPQSKEENSSAPTHVTHTDLVNIQAKSYDEKVKWFQDICDRCKCDWQDGHIKINVRRSHLLQDSVLSLMSLTRADMRKIWRFEFIDESGLDVGGITREWNEIITTQLFNPDMGLFKFGGSSDQLSLDINPASELCCGANHLEYFRFAGRVMGRALFDRQIVKGHLARHLYKHILGWPLTFHDLESVDEQYYRSLKQLQACVANSDASGDELSYLELYFDTTQEWMGTQKTVELIPGGSEKQITNANFLEYVDASLRYKLLDEVKPQLTELLLGFLDVIPEPLLTIFDFQELELLLCGLPKIDVLDWKQNTEYSGDFDELQESHSVCQWFWEIVSNDLDDEMKARLLQFVTGTSGVPSGGFGVLQGTDGNIRKFTITSIPEDISAYPRAHTCFNRIDLPTYETKEQLRVRLTEAITMSSKIGFGLE